MRIIATAYGKDGRVLDIMECEGAGSIFFWQRVASLVMQDNLYCAENPDFAMVNHIEITRKAEGDNHGQ